MTEMLHLEEFGSPLAPYVSEEMAGGTTHPGSADADAAASFEKGYQAGWDDAARAEAEDQTRIGAEFARNLQDIGFTFFEARSHVLRSLESLLSALSEKFLPEVIAKSAGLMIAEEILPMAENAIDAPTQVVVSPLSRQALEPLLATAVAIPLEILEEPSLAPGQIFLRAGGLEKEIDLSGVTARFTNSVSALYQTNDKVRNYG